MAPSRRSRGKGGKVGPPVCDSLDDRESRTLPRFSAPTLLKVGFESLIMPRTTFSKGLNGTRVEVTFDAPDEAPSLRSSLITDAVNRFLRAGDRDVSISELTMEKMGAQPVQLNFTAIVGGASISGSDVQPIGSNGELRMDLDPEGGTFTTDDFETLFDSLRITLRIMSETDVMLVKVEVPQ